MIDILTTSWGRSLRIEHKVAKIQVEQEERGWLLNQDLVHTHIKTLSDMVEVVDNELLPLIPKKTIKGVEVSKPFLKNGNYSIRTSTYLGDQAAYCSGPFTTVSFNEINLASTTQVKEYLLTLGWEPTKWNTGDDGNRTSPKLTEDSFDSLKSDLGKKIAHRIKCCHRRSQLQGLLNNVRSDGRVEARANTIGTPTGRFRHSIVVNIPKAAPEVFFGHQMREIFTVPEGYDQVGCDAKALENRIMLHYLADPELTKRVLEGDWHVVFWDSIRDFSSSRGTSKSIFYAWIYGASDSKLGFMADIRPSGWSDKRIGAAIRASAMAKIPSLGVLVEKVTRDSKRGFLEGIDGRRLYIRSAHSALNLLFQSAGAIAMKVMMCYSYDAIKVVHKLDAWKVGDFHDEHQWEVVCSQSNKAARLLEDSMVKAGQHLKLNVKLEGESKIGKNWAETH